MDSAIHFSYKPTPEVLQKKGSSPQSLRTSNLHVAPSSDLQITINI